jgi:hypothetical protein
MAAFLRRNALKLVGGGGALLGIHRVYQKFSDPEPHFDFRGAFQPFTVAAVEPLTADTRRVRLAVPGGLPLGLRTAGCVVTKVQVPDGSGGTKEVVRPYTPTTLGSGTWVETQKQWPTTAAAGQENF